MISHNLSMSRRIRQTPFTNKAEEHGVSGFTIVNRMLLPKAFKKTIEEDYWHLNSNVQIWDVSCQRQVQITGPDSEKLVQLMTPRSIKNMNVGKCFYIPLIDENAGMINDPVLLKIENNKFWISIADSDVLLWAKGVAISYNLKVNIIEPNGNIKVKEISVNNPLRYKGLTLYQADWSLAALTIQLNNSPKLQIPIKSIPALGEQVWGTIIPIDKDNKDQILLTVENELGPVSIYDNDGTKLITLSTNKEVKVKENLIKIINIIPSSGLLLKRDPGVPIVYTSFAIILLGGSLSIISTNKLWVLSDKENSLIYIGGLSNRNLSGLSKELPKFISYLNS